jgi:hypothetical protein
VRLIVPITGVLILGLASLSTYFFSQQLFQNKLVSFLTGILTICVSVLPYYLINFSRFPQLLGLVFCGLLVGLFILWEKENFSLNFVSIITLITLGQAFTHYRITIMSIIGILLFILFTTFEKINKIDFLKQNLRNWIIYGLSTIIFFSPWVIQLFILQQNGYSGEIGQSNEQFYSINRLGPDIINYYTNLPIFISIIAAIILAIKVKNSKIIWLFSWSVILIAFSNRFFFGALMDTVSVIFSLYVPILVIIGWFLSMIINKVSATNSLKKIILPLLLIPMVGSLSLIPNHIHPEFSFVSSQDLIAFEWIKENTPNDSRFVVNTFNFNFNKNYVIGIDAGYWIPLLANRDTITIPMIFQIEKMKNKNDINNLILVHGIDDYSTIETVNLLKNLGYTHIYLGEWGSKEKLNQLQNKSHYKQVFNDENTYVFEIILGN